MAEVWRLEEHLPALSPTAALDSTRKRKFLVLTSTLIRIRRSRMASCSIKAMADLGGKVEVGEMAVREEARGYCCRPLFCAVALV